MHAVDGISFEVGKGEVFGLLGPNGAGKTTTIEILEGLLKPDGGKVAVLGLDPARDAHQLKERIGVQLQTAALYPNLTVEELIGVFGSFYDRARPTADLVREFGLDERKTALTKELSRRPAAAPLGRPGDGQRSRADLPRRAHDRTRPAGAALALGPRRRAARQQGRTVLLTTHYMEEAEQLCDRVAVMDHGRILEMGTVGELVTRHFKERTVRFTARPELTDERLARIGGVQRVSREGDDSVLYTPDVPVTIGELLKTSDELGLHGLDVAVRRPTLEDVFLELTGRALRD